MLRQRVHVQTSPLALLGRVVLVIFALALAYYGLMLLLLTLGVSPATVDAISGYRTAFDFLSGLTPEDVTGTTRLIIAAAGVAALLIFGYLAYKELPRPYLGRSDVRLTQEEGGAIDVEPRAIERIAETAALENASVSSAAGRLDEDAMTLNVAVKRARDVPDVLRDVQQRARDALARHEVPQPAVNVTLTGFDRQQRRELN